MTLKDDPKFKKKLTCGFKNDIRNLVNFHASSRKSKNLLFDRMLLTKAYKDLDEQIQKSYVSWQWRVMQSLRKNWLLVSKITWRIWWVFTQPLKVQKFHFDRLFLPKVYEVWAKKNTEELSFMTLNSDVKFE